MRQPGAALLSYSAHRAIGDTDQYAAQPVHASVFVDLPAVAHGWNTLVLGEHGRAFRAARKATSCGGRRGSDGHLYPGAVHHRSSTDLTDNDLRRAGVDLDATTDALVEHVRTIVGENWTLITMRYQVTLAERVRRRRT